MIAAAEAAGDREAVLQGRNWRVVDLLELGRIKEAAAEIDAYEAIRLEDHGELVRLILAETSLLAEKYR